MKHEIGDSDAEQSDSSEDVSDEEFLDNDSISDIHQQVKPSSCLSNNTIAKYFQYFRSVVVNYLISRSLSENLLCFLVQCDSVG